MQVDFVDAREGPIALWDNTVQDIPIRIENRSQRTVELLVAKLRFEFTETEIDHEGKHPASNDLKLYIVQIDDSYWRPLQHMQMFIVRINVFKARQTPIEQCSDGVTVNINHLKHRASLKKVSIRYQYSYMRTSPLLKEQVLSREVMVTPSFYFENVSVSDLAKVQEISSTFHRPLHY